MIFRRSLYVAGNFFQLQGLRLIPIVALLLFLPVWVAGWIRMPGDENPIVATRWFVLWLFLAAATSYLVSLRYRDDYGRGGTWARWSSAFVQVSVLILVLFAVDIQQRMNWHFPLGTAVLATAVAIRGLVGYPLRRHYLASAAVLYAWLPLGALGVSASTRHILFPAVLGIALAIAAIGDHLLIDTTLEKTKKNG